MVVITKREANILATKYGYKFGNDGLLHRSYSKAPTYYVTECAKTARDLDKIRKPSYTYAG